MEISNGQILEKKFKNLSLSKCVIIVIGFYDRGLDWEAQYKKKDVILIF